MRSEAIAFELRSTLRRMLEFIGRRSTTQSRVKPILKKASDNHAGKNHQERAPQED